MHHFDIVRKSHPSDSFKVGKIRADYDFRQNEIIEKFSGSINVPDDWKIGVIYGMSGTGKTTIARELFGEPQDFTYTGKSVVDDFENDIDDITKAFSTVGFSSVPSWLKPYAVLSNGEKMRVNLAKCLLSKNELSVYDEFTSVVDRDVARTLCVSIDKAKRNFKKRFVFVTCHSDVLKWLKPDWAFCTDTMQQVFRSAHAKPSYTGYQNAIFPRGRVFANIII